MYFKKLVGTKCYLSPIDINDAEKYTEWLNDQEVVKYLPLNHFALSINNEKDFLQNLVKDHNYAIIDLSTNTLLGNIGINNYDSIYQSAEIGIFIGNKEYWNKGYGTEAMKLLIAYGFDKLNLHSITLCTHEKNKWAIKCYEKIGFKKVGEYRERILVNQKYENLVIMDILLKDFIRL
jgi:RimJ/RimL family protein N-acetyltransferase